MAILQSIDELRRLQRDLADRPRPEFEIRVCSTGCRALGALSVCDALEQQIAERKLEKTVRVVRTGCLGLCAGAVAVSISPQDIFYRGVKPDDAADIIEQTIQNGQVVERLCWSDKHEAPVANRLDIPFYRHQDRRVLTNCGVIDPTSIDDALSGGAYSALARILADMSPEAVIDEVSNSGLRGRGGGGFPTGRKWQFTRGAKGDPKYIVCNADEGDPGAFMDRAILEGDPHLVIEGMIIGAYAIGSTKGFMYIRAEYPIAVEHTEIALNEARKLGLLGKRILGTDLDFDIEIRKGAGAFVCGEETSLIASVEGQRGMPRPRPPFPAVSGLYGKPTNINNVETWANVPRIIEHGAEAYAAVGTEGSKGTKLFALAGKVVNTGLVEVPMGVSLRQVVFDIGGGIPDDKQFKAAQMGGPSGGCVPAEHLDLQIDYDSLQKVGAIMGSGGMIVMDENTCVVDVARFFTDFVQKESCGKCVPCRIGTKRMFEILTRIVSGTGRPDDPDRLDRLGQTIRIASLCGLGQTAPNPVLSTVRYFRDEYDAHVADKACPAGVCKELITYRIITENCNGCRLCGKACPVHAITGEKKMPHTIDTDLCIKCGLCMEKCKFDAVTLK